MSGSLLEIRKKISGVKNTRKITKAMQLVAASKMRQFQEKALNARKYVHDLLKIMENNLTEEKNDLFTKPRETGKTLFVLYTSDKGLCGPLNTKLINCLFRSAKWQNLNNDEKLLFTIGKKSYSFAKANKINISESFIGIPEKITHIDAIKVIDKILEYWKSAEIREVVFVSPHYQNSFTQYPVLKTFLPFTKEAIKSQISENNELETSEKDQDNNTFMYFSPDEEFVRERLYELIIQSIFIECFLELKASEYSSRMIAMQSATDAADRMTNDLNLVYNKARQQAITQEIAELIGASMALKNN